MEYEEEEIIIGEMDFDCQTKGMIPFCAVFINQNEEMCLVPANNLKKLIRIKQMKMDDIETMMIEFMNELKRHKKSRKK